MTDMLTKKDSLSRRDVEVIDGALQIVSGDDEKIQRLDLRLLSFQGDFFANLRDGIPYWGQVFGRGVNVSDLFGIFSDAITNVEGVQAVTELNIGVDTAARQLNITGSAYLDNGTSIAFTAGDTA